MLPLPRAKHLARRSFRPTLGNPFSFKMNFPFFEILQGSKMNVNRLGMFIHQRLRTGL